MQEELGERSDVVGPAGEGSARRCAQGRRGPVRRGHHRGDTEARPTQVSLQDVGYREWCNGLREELVLSWDS